MTSKISVIIPTYNRADLLPRTIDSVINQTYKDWELIIVDDKSTDNTRSVIQEYIKKDNRIKGIFLEKNSGGPAHPRNIGIENAKGEYIAFLDSDDEWLPNKLEKQVDLFNKSEIQNLGFVGCNIFCVDGDNKLVLKMQYKGDIFENLFLGNFIFCGSNVLVKKDLIDKHSLRFDEKLSYLEDWDMWLQITKNNYRFDFVQDPLLIYHLHSNSNTKIYSAARKAEEREYVFRKHYRIFSSADILSRAAVNVGLEYMRSGKVKIGRRYIVSGFLKYPFSLRNVVILAASFCGKFFLEMIIAIKRLLYKTNCV